MKELRQQHFADGRPPEPKIVDYDTGHLDRIDGHVSDYDYGAPQLPAVRPATTTLVLANDTQRRDLSPRQQAVLATSQQMIGGALAMPTHASSHARQDDSAIVVAYSHNIASRPKLMVAGFVFGLLALAIALFWQLGRGEFILIAILAGIAWGGVAMLILQRDRVVALHHSAPGVEHHKIDAQTDVQKTAVQSWETIMLAMIRSEGGEQ